MDQKEKDVSRRSFIKGGIAAALTYALTQGKPVNARSAEGTTSEDETKKTKFYQIMKETADKLGWTIRTAPTTGEHAVGRCLSLNQTKDWEGCISTFNGFQTPEKQADFKPAGYLVYAWGEYQSNEDSGQRLFVFPKGIDELPVNSGDYADGSLFNTFEQQKEAAIKFGFIFPKNLDEPFPPGITGPIGYWGLSKEESIKIGNISIVLP